MQEFRSNGKLLLSGEYLVLDGATALALPTKYGQKLRVTDNDSTEISWTSFDPRGAAWFECSLDLDTLEVLAASHDNVAQRLSKILDGVRQLDQTAITSGCDVETELEFETDWGLGSSSTLIDLIAQWTGVIPMELFWTTSKGSGYDVACAQMTSPIAFCRGEEGVQYAEVEFEPDFADQLFFVHLNEKQVSEVEVRSYHEQKRLIDIEECIAAANELTIRMIEAPTLEEFDQTIVEHELLIATVLERDTVKTTRFKDYKGQVKSLGAWGGDFVLATGPIEYRQYFKDKGFDTIVSYHDMVLTS